MEEMSTDEEKKLAPVAGYGDGLGPEVDNGMSAEVEYVPELRKNFSVWSILGIGFGLTNSWFGISISLVTSMSSGGPIVTVYGIVWITLISGCVGVTLSELASAMPNSGGQYYWALKLAPKKWADFLAYLTGAIGWAGSVFTSASVAMAIGNALMGMIQMNNPDLVIKRWMVFVAYQIFNFVAFLFNCYGKVLPTIGSAAIYISLASFTITFLTVLAKASPKQGAKFVFATFQNETGWESSAIAFILGLINSNWAFACLDAATHLAEEVANPEKVIPVAIMGTVVIGFFTSFIYSIVMFFSIKDLSELVATPTLVPTLELYRQALGSVSGAIMLEFLVCLTGLGCQIACHTYQARLCWSFSRDKGLPGSRYWSKIDKRMGVPFYAHLMSCTLVSVLGTLHIGSTTAFNSMITAAIVLLYISYSIPVVALLIKGRDNITHGPFWLGKFGLFANYVLLAWTLFTLVMYSFPFAKPVLPNNMNYVSVVYAIVFGFVLTYWVIRGKHKFRTKDDCEATVANTLHKTTNTMHEGVLHE